MRLVPAANACVSQPYCNGLTSQYQCNPDCNLGGCNCPDCVNGPCTIYTCASTNLNRYCKYILNPDKRCQNYCSDSVNVGCIPVSPP